MNTKEFFIRWGKGIQAITPFQQSKVNLMGGVLMLVGVIIGLILMFQTKTWWLFLILLGSLFIVGISNLANIQKYIALKRINGQMKLARQEEVEDE